MAIVRRNFRFPVFDVSFLGSNMIDIYSYTHGIIFEPVSNRHVNLRVYLCAIQSFHHIVIFDRNIFKLDKLNTSW